MVTFLLVVWVFLFTLLVSCRYCSQ